MAPSTSFKDFATEIVKLKLPTTMEKVASAAGFEEQFVSLRSVLDTVTRGKPLPAPDSGLRGKSNYILYSSCKPLLGVTVTIDVMQDVVCTNGFSFQLNGISPAKSSTSAQQYALVISGNEISGVVNNWMGPNLIIPASLVLATLSGSIIPAGYRLVISLQNDAAGTITGVTFIVIDNQGSTLKNYPLDLVTFGAKPAQLSPVAAFQLNLVGPDSRENVLLSSGFGSIVYEASIALTVSNSWPCGVTGGTFENANSIYSMLSPGPGKTVSQLFGIGT
jgi:hypothetical protein